MRRSIFALTLGWLGALLVASPAVADVAGVRGGDAAYLDIASDGDAAYLDVASDPAARIVIDEVDTGKITPQMHLMLSAGHHKLTLVTLDGARTRTVGFTVEAGQTRKLTIHLAS